MTPSMPDRDGVEIVYTADLPTFPQVAYLHDFISPDVCRQYISLAERFPMRPATVIRDGETSIDDGFRQCEFVQPGNNHFCELIEKAQALTGWREFQDIQLLHYPPGGFVKSHCDHKGGLSSPRLATLILYLNTVERGGVTKFPKLRGMPGFKPVQGNALFFNYVPDVTKRDLHWSTKTEDEHKWIATLWFTR